jgi:CRISPR/Cas system-associated protein Cas10 (large subunit of type III CRISPR-Cas system)
MIILGDISGIQDFLFEVRETNAPAMYAKGTCAE